MTPAQHLVTSTATSTLFYYLTRSWPGAAVCFLIGLPKAVFFKDYFVKEFRRT